MDYASVVAKLEALASDDAATDAERELARERIKAIKKRFPDLNKQIPVMSVQEFLHKYTGAEFYTDADLFGTM